MSVSTFATVHRHLVSSLLASPFLLVWMGCGSSDAAMDPDGHPAEDSPLGEGDAMGPEEDDKVCAGEVADRDDPTTGCGEATCSPCPRPQGAVRTLCEDGACGYECPEGQHPTSSGCGPAALQIVAAQDFAITDFTCALDIDRTVRCWGFLTESLSLPPAWESAVPQPVAGLTEVESLAAGNRHVCAVTAGGSVHCWGRNDFGQLGDGTTDFSPAPVEVQGLPAPAVAVSAGLIHSCALLNTDDVYCWGGSANLVLGNNDAQEMRNNPPGKVEELGSGVVQLASSDWHNCVLHNTGRVSCWGAGLAGELGNGTRIASSLPVEVAGIDTATSIAVGGQPGSIYLPGGEKISGGQSYATLANGSVKVWGYGDLQLGLGPSVGPVTTPTTLANVSSGRGVVVGPDHTCVLTNTGSATCWGLGGYGKLGAVGMAAPNKIVAQPTAMPDLGQGIARMAASRSHTCMVQDDAIRCVGANGSGQLGNGNPTDYSSVPVEVVW